MVAGPYGRVVSSPTSTWDVAAKRWFPGMEVSVAFCCNGPGDDGLIFGSGGLDC